MFGWMKRDTPTTVGLSILGECVNETTVAMNSMVISTLVKLRPIPETIRDWRLAGVDIERNIVFFEWRGYETVRAEMVDDTPIIDSQVIELRNWFLDSINMRVGAILDKRCTLDVGLHLYGKVPTDGLTREQRDAALYERLDRMKVPVHVSRSLQYIWTEFDGPIGWPFTEYNRSDSHYDQ